MTSMTRSGAAVLRRRRRAVRRGSPRVRFHAVDDDRSCATQRRRLGDRSRGKEGRRADELLQRESPARRSAQSSVSIRTSKQPAARSAAARAASSCDAGSPEKTPDRADFLPDGPANQCRRIGGADPTSEAPPSSAAHLSRRSAEAPKASGRAGSTVSGGCKQVRNGALRHSASIGVGPRQVVASTGQSSSRRRTLGGRMRTASPVVVAVVDPYLHGRRASRRGRRLRRPTTYVEDALRPRRPSVVERRRAQRPEGHLEALPERDLVAGRVADERDAGRDGRRRPRVAARKVAQGPATSAAAHRSASGPALEAQQRGPARRPRAPAKRSRCPARKQW